MANYWKMAVDWVRANPEWTLGAAFAAFLLALIVVR